MSLTENPQRRQRKSGRTKQFAKDWKWLAESGRYPMKELKEVMELLIENQATLLAPYADEKGRCHRKSGGGAGWARWILFNARAG